MTANNFHFDITGANLEKCLEIAKSGHKSVVAWKVDSVANTPRLILYWTPSSTATLLPAPLSEVEAISAFVKSWLMWTDYGSEPDHDGHNTKGWRVYNESWGSVNHEWEAFVAIEPVWLMYGK